MTVRITVGNDGAKTYSVVDDVPLPGATRQRDTSKAAYPFNTMNIGGFFPVDNRAAATAASQAFKSDIYKAAREKGRIVTRALKGDKMKVIRDRFNLPEEAYGVWLMPHKPVEAATETAPA